MSNSHNPLPCMVEPSASNSRTATAHDAWKRRSGLASSVTSALVGGDAADAGIGEPGLLGGLRLQLGPAGLLDHRPRGVVGAGLRHQVGGAVLQPGEGGAGEDLLLGGGALGVTAADERDRPVEQRGDPVLEAGDVDQVDGEPRQPREEAR